jgi:hypothetical protein
MVAISILAFVGTFVSPFIWYYLGKSHGFSNGYTESMQDNGYVWNESIGKFGAWVKYTSSLYDRV